MGVATTTSGVQSYCGNGGGGFSVCLFCFLPKLETEVILKFSKVNCRFKATAVNESSWGGRGGRSVVLSQKQGGAK